MVIHYTLGTMWLIFAIYVYISDRRAKEKSSSWVQTGLIISAIWLATGLAAQA